MPIKALGVKRGDGFTLLREAQDDLPFFEKSGDETFSCRGSLGKCKFIAGRRGERGRQGGTYKVLLFWAEASDAEMCRAYAKDIESALLEGWPWEELHQEYKKSALKYGIPNPTYTPVEEVLFLTGITDPLRAEDLDVLMYTRGFDKDFDLSQRDNSRWQLITERRTYKTTFELAEVTRMYDIIGIKRDDDFTMTLEGVTEERAEIFLCRSNSEEFRFSVKRWAQGTRVGDRIPPTFLLFLYWFYPNWPGNASNNIELCRAHHKDIEAALLNFPQVRMFPNYVPVNKVVFEVDNELFSSDGTKLL